jgi:hypothetical protein
MSRASLFDSGPGSVVVEGEEKRGEERRRRGGDDAPGDRENAVTFFSGGVWARRDVTQAAD